MRRSRRGNPGRWFQCGIATWCGRVSYLSAARARYVSLLSPSAEAIGRNLLGMELSLSYRNGWLKGQSLAEALELSWNHDQDMGATQVGPHRAELSIRLDGTPVKDRISRGQQKLLAAALLIAQIKLFPEGSPVQPTLLLDDPAAELDDERLANLIQRGVVAVGAADRHHVARRISRLWRARATIHH